MWKLPFSFSFLFIFFFFFFFLLLLMFFCQFQKTKKFNLHTSTRKNYALLVRPNKSPLIQRQSCYGPFMQPPLRRHVRLPPIPKPPSKYELLVHARGAIQRMKIRIKYPLMKQMRPFNLNDITALFSWVFVGHTIWLIVGTTSFISLVIWTGNSFQFQGEWVYYLFFLSLF